MATFYDVDVRTIKEPIKKIYSVSKLEEDATIRNFRIVQIDFDDSEVLQDAGKVTAEIARRNVQ